MSSLRTTVTLAQEVTDIAARAAPTFLDLWQVTKAYPTRNGDYVVTEGFNLKIAEGEFVCLIGHSGCGKSTVLNMIAGLIELTSGGIILGDSEIGGPGLDRGMVFQSPCLLPWMTAYDNVMLGVKQVFWHGTADQQHRIVDYYLRLVGLGEAAHLKPGEMSQGMKQRVSLARAFALTPKVLLLDEPFGMLDSLTRLDLQGALMSIWDRDRRTTVMVTHDVDEALFLADRIVMMTNGPRARVGEIMEVPFERPRLRSCVLDHPDYYDRRARIIGFLEDQEVTKGIGQRTSSGGGCG